MIDLISNKCSSHQTIKCALYKISVILEDSNLQLYFLHNGGINIILDLLKLSKVPVYEYCIGLKYQLTLFHMIAAIY